MPIKKELFYVARCPTCGKRVAANPYGDAPYSVHETRADLILYLDGTEGSTIEARIADSCSTPCGNAYAVQRRLCRRRKSKTVPDHKCAMCDRV